MGARVRAQQWTQLQLSENISDRSQGRQSAVLWLASWSQPHVTSVFPSPKVDQWFSSAFSKRTRSRCPPGNMKGQPLPRRQEGQGPSCRGCAPCSQAPWEEGRKPGRGCGVSCPHSATQTRLPKVSGWAFFLEWLCLGNLSLSHSFFPLFLFGKFDQVASERTASGMKSKPELWAPGAPAWFP